MSVKVDLSELRALHRAAKREFDRMPAMVLEVVQGRAEVERRTHKFKNITGRLERNTRGQLVSGDQDPLRVSLVMTMQYASFVQNRGRTAIEKRAKEAAAMILRRLHTMRDRLSEL